MYFVYVLQSKKDGKFYIGYTENIERRIGEHNRGKNKSTRNRYPFELVYQEGYKTKTEAIKRENKLKRCRNSVFLRNLFNTGRVV